MSSLENNSASVPDDDSGSEFDRHTAIEKVGPGSWRAETTSELSGFGGGTHGGYVAAIALRTLGEVGSGMSPRSLTLNLFSRIDPGPFELRSELDRGGASMSSASLRIERGDTRLATASAILGDARPSVSLLPLRMPEVPSVEEGIVIPVKDKPIPEGGMGRLVEHRLAGALPQAVGKDGRLFVWMRLVEDRPLDALAMTMLVDAAPPALYAALERFVPIPSVEIAVKYHAEAVDDPWVLADLRTVAAGDGWTIEAGEFWAQDGTLVATSNQLRRILEPRE
jgi:hypothetical protein